MAVFINEFGNQIYSGTDAEYDQVDYAGLLQDYTFFRNDDGTVTVDHPNFGTDTLSSIEGFWFQGESRWYSMEDALVLSPGNGANPPPPPPNTNIDPADLDNVAISGQSNAGNMFWYLDDRTDLPQGSQVFESRISELTGFETEFINAAYPAAASNENATDRGLFFWDLANNRPGDGLLDSVRDIQNAMDQGEDLDALVWLQGESDAYSIFYGGQPELQLARYIEATLATFDYYRSIFGEDLPIFIIEQGDFEIPVQNGVDAWQLIRQAQIDIANNDPNIFLSVDTTGLPVWTDGLHFTTEGYGEVGLRLAEAIFAEFTDGTVTPPVEPPVEPPSEFITGTNGDDLLFGTAADDIFESLIGQDIVIGTGGNDVINLGGGYDQVNYDGQASDYGYVRNTDGTVTVTKPDGSFDTLTGVDGFWFQGEEAWYSMDAVIATFGGGNPPGGTNTITGTNGDDLLFGTAADDVVDGLDGRDVVIGSDGDDTISLSDGYDQVDYAGSARDYNMILNADGSITVTKPGGGIDILEGVDGFWFQGEAAWYSADDLVMDLFG